MTNRTAAPGIWRRTIVRTALVLAVLGLVAWFGRGREGPQGVPAPADVTPADQGRSPVANPIEDMVIRDQDGDVAFRGTIDLTETLQRVQKGKKLRFPNDGSVFQNREKRLPVQPAGYYHEWVHPTPGLDGPGPQRIVTGERGEIYYTSDHYRTFRRLDGGQESGVRGQESGDKSQ